MFQEMEGCFLFVPVPRYGKPTAVETKGWHVGATLQYLVRVCGRCGGVALGAREGRCGYRSYNTMHKARGQLMTCRWVLLETSSFPPLLE